MNSGEEGSQRGGRGALLKREHRNQTTFNSYFCHVRKSFSCAVRFTHKHVTVNAANQGAPYDAGSHTGKHWTT